MYGFRLASNHSSNIEWVNHCKTVSCIAVVILGEEKFGRDGREAITSLLPLLLKTHVQYLSKNVERGHFVLQLRCDNNACTFTYFPPNFPASHHIYLFITPTIYTGIAQAFIPLTYINVLPSGQQSDRGATDSAANTLRPQHPIPKPLSKTFQWI